MMKPRCELVGTDGNVFSVIGLAARALRKAGLAAQAEEMSAKVFRAGSYEEALGIVQEYVEAY